MAKPFKAGQLITVTATIKDEASGNPLDPTTEIIRYAIYKNGALVTGPVALTYASASSPAPGVVARTGQGVYVAQLDSTGLDGHWKVASASSGTGQDYEEREFDVEPAGV